MTIVHIYVTFPNLEEAKRLGQILLEQRLIACANYHPIRSDYIWKGQLTTDDEFAASFKTLIPLEEKVRKCIEDAHSYVVPLIASHEMKVNESYYEWMKGLCI